MVYEPQEDSYLLKKTVESYCASHTLRRALDMCTGTGLVAASIIADEVYGVDADDAALEEAKKRHANAQVTWIQSDLFFAVEGEFDLITCNPPYLPNELHDPDIALDGGEKGHEFICRFLKEAANHLSADGAILLLFSSRSNPDAIFVTMKKLGLSGEKVAEEHFFFEDLWVYRISKP